ncbi:hypothetical protein FVE85_0995 [Porphyridium purpureum]|uniref:Methyltransferase domain-containing protein n=1 Tax=Porphyridium purpureum TaxID=35688 RepID=A0A5J4Z0X7_PORPP|nr:hypothetical protein FVE85_0995 [Porphyridium purpureum]|eukprot:POR3893..scf208_2
MAHMAWIRVPAPTPVVTASSASWQRARRPPLCSASPLSKRAIDEPVPTLGPVAAAVNRVLQLKPLLQRAQSSATEMMRTRGSSIGADWAEHKAYVERLAPEQHLERLVQSDTLRRLPQYYNVSFHAYQAGNRCWSAAMDADVATLTVHSTLFDEENPSLLGDEQMRFNFCSTICMYLEDEVDDARCVVDVGASTGLSTRHLLRTFSNADIVALDLSEHMLAVASALLEHDGLTERVSFVHAAAEDMPRVVQRRDVDAVVMSLVAHELPRGALGQILEAAFELMEEDALLAILEIDPDAPAAGRLLSNPFFRGLFRSTEPYLDDYLTLDLPRAISEAGFTFVAKHGVSPRHAAFIAYKPRASDHT